MRTPVRSPQYRMAYAERQRTPTTPGTTAQSRNSTSDGVVTDVSAHVSRLKSGWLFGM